MNSVQSQQQRHQNDVNASWFLIMLLLYFYEIGKFSYCQQNLDNILEF